MVSLSKEASNNKKNLINRFFNVIVGNKKYEFKIKDITHNEIFIQRKFYFEELVSEYSEDSFEIYIQNLITDSDEFIHNPLELRQRSAINKKKLLRKVFAIPIGDKKSAFRIISITSKHIKIESVLKFRIIEKIYSQNILSLEYILHEFIIGNDIDYTLFKLDIPSDPIEDAHITEDSDEPKDIIIDIGDIEKLSDDELESKVRNIKGWQKIVFDSIDAHDEDVFTLEILEKEEIYDRFRFQGESLIPTIENNIIPLIDIGLVKKYDENHFVKLW